MTIARDAGHRVMAFAEAPATLRDKPDGSPVTEADLAAHRAITEALKAWDPSVPIVSEEGEAADYATRQQWTRFWLVDPLDGTREFLAREPDFTVNIALVQRSQPIAGVVYAPARDAMYIGARGIGSWRQIAGGPMERLQSAPPTPGRPLRVVESRFHPSARLDEYLASLPVGERVTVGSSLKFCRLAEGAADLYPRLGPIMEWDVAAGDCVYRYSGSGADRFSPLRYNGLDFRIPEFVIGIPESQ